MKFSDPYFVLKNSLAIQRRRFRTNLESIQRLTEEFHKCALGARNFADRISQTAASSAKLTQAVHILEFNNMASKTTTRKRRKVSPQTPQLPRMNSSEALMSFVAFLTSRTTEIRVSDRNDPSPIMELLKEFGLYHRLPVIREGHIRATKLEHLDHIGSRVNMAKIAFAPSWDESLESVINHVRYHPTQLQNKLVARVLRNLTDHRQSELDQLLKDEEDVKSELTKAIDAKSSLKLIREGGFEELNME